MHMFSALGLALLFIVAALPAARAGGNLPASGQAGCHTLSDNHQAARKGNEALLVKDGDTHLELGFNGSCRATTLSSKVNIATGGQANVVCASGTEVRSRTDRCSVSRVTPITAEAFQRHARRR